jgi:hypothetical protein
MSNRSQLSHRRTITIPIDDGRETHTVEWSSDIESLSTVPPPDTASHGMPHNVKQVYKELQDISNRLKVRCKLSHLQAMLAFTIKVIHHVDCLY